MRNDQANPRNRTANTHAGRGDQGCQQNGDTAGAGQVNAEGARFIVTEREDIDTPTHRQEQQDAGCRHQRKLRECFRAYVLQGTHLPEHDLRQLSFRVRNELQRTQRGGAKATHNHAGKHQHERGLVLEQTRNAHGQQYCREAAGEGGTLNGDARAHTQQNGGGGTHRRTLRNTQQVRGDQRVTEDRLEGSTRNGEGSTDEPGGEQTRNTYGQ